MDYDSIDDQKVTIREIESMKQVRIAISELTTTVGMLLKREIQFTDLINKYGEVVASQEVNLEVEGGVGESKTDTKVSLDDKNTTLIKLDDMEKILKFTSFLDSIYPTKKDFDHLKSAELADSKKYPNVARYAATLNQ